MVNVNENDIKQLVSDIFKLDIEKIESQSHFFKDLGADSLELLSFVNALEETYNIEVDSDDFDKLFNVENVVNYVTEQEVCLPA